MWSNTHAKTHRGTQQWQKIKKTIIIHDNLVQLLFFGGLTTMLITTIILSSLLIYTQNEKPKVDVLCVDEAHNDIVGSECQRDAIIMDHYPNANTGLALAGMIGFTLTMAGMIGLSTY